MRSCAGIFSINRRGLALAFSVHSASMVTSPAGVDVLSSSLEREVG